MKKNYLIPALILIISVMTFVLVVSPKTSVKAGNAKCPDFDKNGKVDNKDQTEFSAAFGSKCDTKYTSKADIDKDGDVDTADFDLLTKAWRSVVGDANYDPRCDLDSDGKVFAADYSIFSGAWDSTCNLNYNTKCDFDSDYDVDGSDLAFFSSYFGTDVDTSCNITCNNNKVCDINETYQTCPSDCPKPIVCGDGICEGSETYENCPQDCPKPVKCGDTITKNTVLTNDLLNCPGNGLVVNAGVTLDCNGRKITGATGNSYTALTLKGSDTPGDGAIAKNCVVSGFGGGTAGRINVVGKNALAKNNTIDGGGKAYGIFLSSYGLAKGNKVFNADWCIGNDEGSYLTIEDNNISDCEIGINVLGHTNQTVLNNTIDNCSEIGINLSPAYNSVVSGNKISNSLYGIKFFSYYRDSQICGTPWISNHNVLKNNQLNNNTYPLIIEGSPSGACQYTSKEKNYCDFPNCYDNTIDTTNTINGKPIYYLYKKSNQTYENLDAGYFACMECDNITVKNVTTPPGYFGFFFYKNNNLKLENIIAKLNKYGIYLVHSTSTTLTNSTIENNSYYDVYNVDQEQSGASNSKGGVGMCYDPVHKICPFAIKSSYYVKIFGCPDLDADGDVDANDETLFNKAFPSRCDKNYDSRPDLDKDGNVDSGDLVKCISAFGSLKGDLKYNAQCDFDNDGDVDGSDQVIIGNAYGTICNLNFNVKADFNGDTKINEEDQKRFTAY